MQKQLAAAVALLCLGVACGLLMGEECQKACDDNFMKCTHDAGQSSPGGQGPVSGYVYYPFNPTASDAESVWERDIKHCWYTYENQCSNRCGFPL